MSSFNQSNDIGRLIRFGHYAGYLSACAALGGVLGVFFAALSFRGYPVGFAAREGLLFGVVAGVVMGAPCYKMALRNGMIRSFREVLVGASVGAILPALLGSPPLAFLMGIFGTCCIIVIILIRNRKV